MAAAITMTVRRRGAGVCPSPYPPITEMPAFELRDLAGKRVDAASLKGKPTLINFYFARLRAVHSRSGAAQRVRRRAARHEFSRGDIRRTGGGAAFVDRYRFRWRVVPDARELIDRIRVKQYPTMALFDGNGRLLGTRRGGVRDELEAANVGPQLARWVDGLLRTNKVSARRGEACQRALQTCVVGGNP